MLVPWKVYDPIQGGPLLVISGVVTLIGSHIPSYSFIRPLIGVITYDFIFITGRGQPCTTFFLEPKQNKKIHTFHNKRHLDLPIIFCLAPRNSQ